MLATTMRSKSFAERIADVLIEDGLLLPNQLEEAVGIQQKEGGRLLKILTDRQFVTDQDMTVSMGRCLNTPLDQSFEVARAGGSDGAGPARHGEGEQARPDRAPQRQAFRRDGRSDQCARGGRREAARPTRNRADDRDGEVGQPTRSRECTAPRT